MAATGYEVPCYFPLSGFKDPISGGLTFNKRDSTGEVLEVACGQCLGCRVDRSRMWAMRITHESTMHADQFGSCFITLTYRDKSNATAEQLKNGQYMPEDMSLRKRDFKNFIRRLRRHFPDRKIRYFHCGEYGELGRPHYHACLFNVQFDDQVLYTDTEGLHTYSSASLQKLWPHGFSTVAELNFDTAAYTSAYIFKKVNGKKQWDHYLRNDAYGVAYWLQPEYITMSLKPGIGATWYEKYKSDVFPADETPVPGKGVYQMVPRYYEKILESQDPGQLELVKQMRQAFIAAHGDDFTPARLQQKYQVTKAKFNQKERQLP